MRTLIACVLLIACPAVASAQVRIGGGVGSVRSSGAGLTSAVTSASGTFAVQWPIARSLYVVADISGSRWRDAATFQGGTSTSATSLIGPAASVRWCPVQQVFVGAGLRLSWMRADTVLSTFGRAHGHWQATQLAPFVGGGVTVPVTRRLWAELGADYLHAPDVGIFNLSHVQLRGGLFWSLR